MSERKINLEEILIEVFEPSPQNCQTPTQDLQLAITLNPDLNKIKEAMIEFGKRLLELAAENAKTVTVRLTEGVSGVILPTWEDQVDKQSILDTINQIE